MTKKERDQLEQKIKQSILQTEKTIKGYEETARAEGPNNAIGRISRMDAIHNKSLVKAALREAHFKLKNLKVMLSQIDDKNFGQCAKCKQTIPLARLLYLPQSRFCVHCAR